MMHLFRPLCLVMGITIGVGMVRAEDPLPLGATARLGTIRLLHPQDARLLVYSPDGKTLVSTGADGTVRFWDTTTGREQGRINTGGTNVTAIDMAATGKRLALVVDGEYQVWHLPGIRKEWEGRATHGNIGGVIALSPDALTLAVFDKARSVSLYNLETGKPKGKIRLTRDLASPILFSPDGKYLITGSDDALIRVWDVNTGRKCRTFEGHDKTVTRFSFSPDGKILASNDGTPVIRFWNLDQDEEVGNLQIEGRVITEVWFGANSGEMIVETESTLIQGVDRATGKPVGPAYKTPNGFASRTMSPDRKRVALTGKDGVILLADLASGKPVPYLQRFGNFANVQPVPGGLVAMGVENGSLALWRPGPGQPARMLAFPENTADRIVVSPSGKWVATVGNKDGIVHLRDLMSGKEIHSFTVTKADMPIEVMSFTPEDSLVTIDKEHRIKFWDLPNGKPRLVYPMEECSGLLAFSPDCRCLVVVNAQADLALLERASGRVRRTLVLEQRPSMVAFSPDGQSLACEDNKGMLHLFSLATGKILWRTQAGDGVFVQIVFSPDSRVVITGSHDGKLHSRDVRDGQELNQLEGHRGIMTGLAILPDHKHLVSCSDDGTALVWDLETVVQDRRPQLKESVTLKQAELWQTLGDPDAGKAYDAILALARQKHFAVELVSSKIRPAPSVKHAELVQLLGDLDHDQYPVRERAEQRLQELDTQAEAFLREAAVGTLPLHVKLRVEHLLTRLQEPIVAGEQLRAIRALEVLELVNTNASRKLLEEIAQGAADARLTLTARDLLGRLKRRGEAPTKGVGPVPH